MDVRFWAALAVMLLAGLAGCAGNDAGQAKNLEQDPSATHGNVLGLVTDDEALPLGEVSIRLKSVKVSPIALSVLTNTDGRFRLQNVPAGRQTVLAEKSGYNSMETTITVVPGSDTTVRIVLTPKPIEEYKVVPLAKLDGHYDCAAEWFANTGSCDYEVKNVTGSYVLDVKNNHTFEVPTGWGGLLFEVTWQAGVQQAIDGIRFQLESQEDLGGMFIKADAPVSPFRITVNAGQVAPDATLGYPIPQRGVKTWIHVLPLGLYDGATCTVQCGRGIGAAIDLRYSVFITIFFGGPVDDSYSAFEQG